MRAWPEIRRKIRRREIELIFGGYPDKYFGRGLELGAGDGFQATVLSRYVGELYSTDLNLIRLKARNTPGIQYLICDAQRADRVFRPNSFNLVFSSNLLEHLASPQLTLQGIFNVLVDGGVSISVMPSPFMKLMWLAFFYPNKIARGVELVLDPDQRRDLVRRRRAGRFSADEDYVLSNNPHGRQWGFIRRQLWPIPHGAYNSNVEEFVQFRKKRWTELIEEAGLSVVRVIRMPVTTGYRVDWRPFLSLLEKIGLASAYAFIATKELGVSPKPHNPPAIAADGAW